MEYTFFVVNAAKAIDMNDMSSPMCTSMPPVGKLGDKTILIHLAAYENWRTRTPWVNSGMLSENDSLAPVFVPFPWAPGVLDGQQQAAGRQPRPGGCEVLVPPSQRRERDPDNDFEGPRHWDIVTKSTRVR